jgi:hypothetical protein
MVMPRSFSRSLESITRSIGALVVAERAGLLQQLVDEGGFAMVNVGDDRDVASRWPHTWILRYAQNDKPF